MLENQQPATAEQVQWRNIRNVVRQVAEFCFGSAEDKTFGSSFTAVVNSLTAKDGVQVKLEPLPVAPAAQVDQADIEALQSMARSFSASGIATRADANRIEAIAARLAAAAKPAVSAVSDAQNMSHADMLAVCANNPALASGLPLLAANAAPGDAPPAAGDPASADDIRAAGWAVAVHNDYRLNGQAHTFWLFTKAGRAVKGEGKTDAEALEQVRAEIGLASPDSSSAAKVAEVEGHFEYIETICEAYEQGLFAGISGQSLVNPYAYRVNPDQHAAFEAGHTVGVRHASSLAATPAGLTDAWVEEAVEAAFASRKHATSNDVIRAVVAQGLSITRAVDGKAAAAE
jgi:hypothetical protein